MPFVYHSLDGRFVRTFAFASTRHAWSLSANYLRILSKTIVSPIGAIKNSIFGEHFYGELASFACHEPSIGVSSVGKLASTEKFAATSPPITNTSPSRTHT